MSKETSRSCQKNRCDDSNSKVNWLCVWEASGNDWHWMIAPKQDASLGTNKSNDSRRWFKWEILCTALLLMMTLILNKNYRDSSSSAGYVLSPVRIGSGYR